MTNVNPISIGLIFNWPNLQIHDPKLFMDVINSSFLGPKSGFDIHQGHELIISATPPDACAPATKGIFAPGAPNNDPRGWPNIKV